MLRQQADPQAAIGTVWHSGHLLMNAGYPKLAAETFAAVRDLDTQGSDLWWHATYEEGLVRADVGDWSRARGLLRGIQESLLVNYAAWLCFAPGVAELGLARLSDGDEASAHRPRTPAGRRDLAGVPGRAGEDNPRRRLLPR
jgi:hypothetical protein